MPVSTPKTRYVLRKATDSDVELAYLIMRSAIKEYVAQTWSWTEDFQHQYYRLHFSSARMHIITVDCQPAGLIRLRKQKNFVFIEDFYLIPTFQNQGIGSHLMQRIQETCKQKGKMIKLEVLDVNEKALAFYKRHGFVITGRKPEKKIMEWRSAIS